MYSSLNHFGISADVLYSQRGAKSEATVTPLFGNPVQETFKQRINYLEIPVALRYFLTLEGNFRPNVYFGPALGVKLNAQHSQTTRGNMITAGYNSSAEFWPS